MTMEPTIPAYQDRDFGEFRDWPESKRKEAIDALRFLIQGGFEEDLLKEAFTIAGLESDFDPAAEQEGGLGRGLLQIDLDQWDPDVEGNIWPSSDGKNPDFIYRDGQDLDTDIEGVIREHPTHGNRSDQRRPMLREYFNTKGIDREEYQQPWKETTNTIFNPIANARYARDNIYQSGGEKDPWRAFTTSEAVKNLKGLRGEEQQRKAEIKYHDNDLLRKESAINLLYDNISHIIPDLVREYSPHPIKELDIMPSELGFKRTAGFR